MPIAERYGVKLNKPIYSQRFDELVIKLRQKYQQKVVLLIDEYDKPILNNLDKSVLTEIKQVITAFYGVINGG